MEISKEGATRLVEKTYSEFCKILRIIDGNNTLVAEFPISTARKLPFDPDTIKRNGWHLVPVSGDVRESSSITSITSGFWTCDCPSTYVRHCVDSKCSKCGTHINDSKYRLFGLWITESDKSVKMVTIH